MRTKTLYLHRFKWLQEVLKTSTMARSFELWVLYRVLARIICQEKKATRCHWPILDSTIGWSFGSWFTWPTRLVLEVNWLSTLPMVYAKVSVLIWIWYFGSKCLKSKASVKLFSRCMKTFLAPEVRKSVSRKLTFDFFSTFWNLTDFHYFYQHHLHLIALVYPDSWPRCSEAYC